MDIEEKQHFKNLFTKAIDWRKSEGLEECRNVIDGICNNILSHYDLIDHVSKSKSKPQAIAKYYKEKKPFFEQLTQDSFIRVIDKQNDLLRERTRLYHVRVHKQFVPNLCGFHATYNLVQGVHAIKFGIPVQFEKVASFWSYVHHTQQFLFSYRNRYGMDSSIWPWRDEDILKGDFERTYFKVCAQGKPLFKETFVNEVYDGVSFEVRMNCLYYQYGNIINNQKEREEFERDINDFIKFKADKKREFIMATMLGVTNHWLALISHKNASGCQFYLMDSRNRDCLLWTEQEVRQFLIQENQERQKRGQEVWVQFYLDLYEQGMKDIQVCVDLMLALLTAQTTMDNYVNNSRMKVFLRPLISAFQVADSEFLNYELKDMKKVYTDVNLWADAYMATIEEYLYLSIKQITSENAKILRKTVTILEKLVAYQLQNNLWPNNKKKSPLQRVLQHLQLIQSRI